MSPSGVPEGITSVAVATPVASVNPLRSQGIPVAPAKLPACGSTSKLIRAFCTGSPKEFSATPVISVTPSALSVTVTSVGLAEPSTVWTKPGRLRTCVVLTLPTDTVTWKAVPLCVAG